MKFSQSALLKSRELVPGTSIYVRHGTSYKDLWINAGEKVSRSEFFKDNKYIPQEAVEAREDFNKFRLYVCGHETFAHQQVWYDQLITNESNDFLFNIAGKDTCILAPRNSGKSTFVAQWVAYIIGYHASKGISLKILYISYSLSVTLGKSRQIKAIIESERYQQVFPIVQASKEKWAEGEWAIDFEHAGLRSIDEQYTLACSGLSGSVNSRRAHLIVLDDLIKDTFIANNKQILDRMADNWNNIVRFTLFDGGRCVNLGTRMSEFDLYATTFIPTKNWKVIQQKALLRDAHNNPYSYWENGISVKSLLEEELLDSLSFLLQRQNEIPLKLKTGISYECIHKRFLPSSFDRLILGIDTADSTEKRDNATAIVCIGIKNDEIFVAECWAGHIQGSLSKIEKLYSIWCNWFQKCERHATIAVDANRWSKGLEGDFKIYNEKFIEINGVNPLFKNLAIEKIASSNRGDKLDRLLSHYLLFETRKVHFNKISNSYLDDLIKEITEFSIHAHNDLMDALEVGIFEARKEFIGALRIIPY